nr:FAD-binding protein [Actinomycetales bacterium]
MAENAAHKFDYEFDVVVVGTGGAGFATALGAVDSGLSVLMLESGEKWGGNTAMSGGGMWLPNNPLMQRDRVGDSRAEALDYLEATIGDGYRATSRERKEAFVDGVDDFVLTAEKHGFRFARATDYPDYYPELPGGKIGRAIEVEPFDAKVVGEWASSISAPALLGANTDDVWLLGRAWSTFDGMVRGASVVFRILGGAITGKKLAGIGGALGSAFMKAVVVDGGGSLWLKSPLEDLITDDEGRVIGVRTVRDGAPVTVRAHRGVMLAAGGFDHNVEWRRKYHGIDGFSSGARTNTGRPIELAEKVGAALELMDDAWWGPSLAAVEGGEPSFVVGERSMPYSIIVDGQGAGVSNESESYVDFGHRMLEHNKDGDYWLVADARHARRYLRTFALDPRAMKAMRQQGIVHSAKTLADLAGAIGADAEVLKQTVQEFNGYARSGVDGKFGRGNSAYDRYYGDPTVSPNPVLGPIEKGPFMAYKLVIGDLGTKGGVLTDTEGRALREDGSVIEGLYAAGNNSASMMGRTYPGPGSTLGPATVFGMRAARDMAGVRVS